MDDTTIAILGFCGGAALFLLGLLGLPRLLVWYVGYLAHRVESERGPALQLEEEQPHRQQQAAAHSTSDDAVRRLLHTRQTLQPLLDGEERENVDAQFLKLHDTRAKAQAEVQRLFDSGVTIEKLRTMPTITNEQLATIQEWIVSGDVVPPHE